MEDPLLRLLISCHHWSISIKLSPPKLFGQMNGNLVGSIYGKSIFRADHTTNMAKYSSCF